MRLRKVFRVDSQQPDLSLENLHFEEIAFEDIRCGDRFVLQDFSGGEVPPVERGDCIYTAVTDSYLKDGVPSVDVEEEDNIQLTQPV